MINITLLVMNLIVQIGCCQSGVERAHLVDTGKLNSIITMTMLYNDLNQTVGEHMGHF